MELNHFINEVWPHHVILHCVLRDFLIWPSQAAPNSQEPNTWILLTKWFLCMSGRKVALRPENIIQAHTEVVQKVQLISKGPYWCCYIILASMRKEPWGWGYSSHFNIIPQESLVWEDKLLMSLLLWNITSAS